MYIHTMCMHGMHCIHAIQFIQNLYGDFHTPLFTTTNVYIALRYCLSLSIKCLLHRVSPSSIHSFKVCVVTYKLHVLNNTIMQVVTLIISILGIHSNRTYIIYCKDKILFFFYGYSLLLQQFCYHYKHLIRPCSGMVSA